MGYDADFRPDPRVDEELQTLAEATQANTDSFYVTIIAPQLAGFNQSGAAGLSGRLEDALLELATLDRVRIDVQAGPVLAETDLP